MFIGLIIIMMTILIDQVSKQLSVAFIKGGDSIVLWKNMIEFHYHENYGVSFSSFEGQYMMFFLVGVVSLGLFGYLFLESDFKHKKIYSISIALFIGGTFGNMIDRALFGFVIDWLHFPFLTPILELVGLSNFYNNMADMFLSAAIVLFVIDLFVFEPKRTKALKESDDAKTI
jgi:signal peptidase II